MVRNSNANGYPTPADILTLVEAYCRHTGYGPGTVGRRVAGSDKLVSQCEDGRLSFGRASRVVARFARHWPEDLPWPRNIARPELRA